jgi:hypothetical protein
MGRKGDLLELIDGAPIGVSTLRGSVWKWTHHERSRRAVTALTRSHGTSSAVSWFGGQPHETDDEHLRVAIGLPDRWRFESEDGIDLRNDTVRWIGTSAHLTEVTGDRTALEDTDIGMFVSPGGLLGALRFGDPSDDLVAGRPCLKVEATTGIGRNRGRMLPVELRLGGLVHMLWVDAATGIVLRHVGLIDDDACTITEFTEVTVDPPLTDVDFQFIPPPDAVIERHIDHMLRMAELRGADLTGVDRTDPAAVRTAVSDSVRPRVPTPEDVRASRRAKHLPVGDPPGDVDAARSAIEHAFTHLEEVDGSGEGLVNVQGGRAMAGPLQDAHTRIPGRAGATVAIVVDDIEFLRPDQAVVWYSVELDGSRFAFVDGREGRAVVVGGRWMVERATVVDLLGSAGVLVPPP